MESMVLVRLVSGVGRDIFSGESAETSVNGSRNIDWLNLSRGGMSGCFSTGCAQSGIRISTCLGFALSLAAAVTWPSRWAGVRPGVSGNSVTGDGSLPLDRKVEKEPYRASAVRPIGA